MITDNPRKPTDEPWFPRPPYFEYTLTFSTVGKAAVTASLNGNAGDVLLDPGTWTLNIIGTYSGETVAESAPVTVTVPDNGDLVSVSVTVHPVLNGAKGTFNSSNIFYSEGLTNVSVVLTPLDVGSAEQSEIVLTYGQTISLAPGYYRLSIRAMKGNQLLIRREIVHIYSYTRTEKTYLLTEADFAPAVYLGGTLTGGIEGYSPTMVIVYEDADCRVDIGQGAVSGDAWSMEAEGTRETLYFKVQLTKDAAGGDHTRVYYSKLIEVIGISTAGKMDMVLLIEAYTVTFDANGGLFEDGETVITMTAPENETLTLPSAPRGERAFTGWYDVGRLFTAETRVNGDIVLYAGWLLELGDIADYLANAQGGATADDPVQLTLSPDLANKGWETVLSAVHASDKYVTLDLSGAVMTGTEFAPGYAAAGVTKIVALILPDAAKSINTTFNAFTALGSIIGASVEAVGGYAFSGCAALTSVSLPAADSIGGYAFSGCTALTSVSLPAATSIGDYAFSGTALTSVSLPAATSIGREAFSGTALTSVSLPAATSIGDYAFSDYERRQYCTALESVSLPKATSIGERAFYGCAVLESVSLPAATDIGSGAFSGCTALESVSLPAATAIGYSAFYDCTSLASVSLPVAASIGDYAFSDCTALTSVSLPAVTDIGISAFHSVSNGKSVSCPLTVVSLPAATAIGDGAFSDCPLTSVSLPKVTSIGDYAFSGCPLTELSLPAAASIGNYAFAYCDALESVSLPAVTDIGGSVFYGCSNLTYITVNPDMFTIRDGMLLDKAETTLIMYFYARGDIILPSITAVSDGAFSGCTNLTSVSLPKATSIGNRAFYACTALTSVSLPKATSIGDYAFAGYIYSVGSAYIVYSVPLTSVNLPLATSIGEEAFYLCAALESVSLPLATSIGDGAFSSCSALESVSLPSATSIGDSAFASCKALTSVSLPSATSIGNRAFSGTYDYQACTALVSVDLPAATSIGELAFYYCTSLESVSLPATPPSIIPRSAFVGIFSGTGSSGTITISVFSYTGDVSTYTSVWGVSAETAAGGNLSVYGNYHKAITLVSVGNDNNIKDYLVNAQGGATPDDPIPLALDLPFAEWKGLLFAINESGKYVSLDLAAWTINGTEFDPGTGNTGADKVARLVLPDAAKSIKAGRTLAYPTFKDFTALGSISGTSVETVGDYAFSGCTALTSVSLPVVTDIGNYAFQGTSISGELSLPVATSIGSYAFQGTSISGELSLPVATSIGGSAFQGTSISGELSLPMATSIGGYAFQGTSISGELSLPVATSIGYDAFQRCTALESVSLPVATSIDSYAFSGTALTSVSLPAATSIGNGAFYNCAALTTVSLPSATSIGSYAFAYCDALESVSLPATPPSISTVSYGIFYYTSSDGTITITVPAGAVSAYTSAWGVDAETPAGGNTGVYGSNHKAVLISE